MFFFSFPDSGRKPELVHRELSECLGECRYRSPPSAILLDDLDTLCHAAEGEGEGRNSAEENHLDRYIFFVDLRLNNNFLFSGMGNCLALFSSPLWYVEFGELDILHLCCFVHIWKFCFDSRILSDSQCAHIKYLPPP